jgi:pyruvate formate lyase activating enzyme
LKKEAMLYEKLENGKVHCFLCSHHCRIAPSGKGFCNVRENIDGTLFTNSYGKVISMAIDPIEKKPLYHFLPGTGSFSIAAVGCNFKCGFCQNWQISQADEAERIGLETYDIQPQNIIKQAEKANCPSISYTYTEPTIFFEYAYDTAQIAKQRGLYNIFVTNGYMTKDALDTIRPVLDAANVDLKSFSDEFYKRTCKARLQPVLDSIRYMKEIGIWVEVTTLVIPGQNDSPAELNEIAGFIAAVDKNIPWHISRFYPQYHFSGSPPTPVETLRYAAEAGEKQGLRFVYLGNVAEGADTLCCNCKTELVTRSAMAVKQLKIKNGRCPDCGADIAGVWS